MQFRMTPSFHNRFLSCADPLPCYSFYICVCVLFFSGIEIFFFLSSWYSAITVLDSVWE